MLEDALEHVVCEGRNWIFFVGETDEQHCVAGGIDPLLAGGPDPLVLAEKIIVFVPLLLLAFA